MEIFARAGEFISGEALTRAKSRLALARARMLRTLQSQIDAYRAEIEKLFADHPDSGLFGSLPGTGSKIAPRLLGEIGSESLPLRGRKRPAVFGGHRACQLSERSDPQGSSAATMQQAASPRRAPMGQPEPPVLPVGGDLLRYAPQTRQEPRLRVAMPRPALAENPLENVADRHPLRRRSPRS